MVCSTNELIAAGRRLRKRMGGGMRQVGVIAAAARVAIEGGRERLSEDHANATRLAEGLAELDPAAVELDKVETNMVYVDLSVFGKQGDEVSAALLDRGVVTLGAGSTMRLVCHRDVSAVDIEVALVAFREVVLS
jgi:threonine aldolase